MRFRAITVLVVSAAAVSGFGQALYSVTKGGKPAGSATVSSKITAKGEKLEEMYLKVQQNGQGADIRVSSGYKRDGSPLRKVQMISVIGTSTRLETQVEFDAKGANVMVIVNGKVQRKSIAYPEGKAPKELDEFWFVRDHPKPGFKYKGSTFDTSTLAWQSTQVTYVGDETITVGGKRMKAHRLDGVVGNKSQTVWEDRRGVPLKIVEEDLVIERVWKGGKKG